MTERIYRFRLTNDSSIGIRAEKIETRMDAKLGKAVHVLFREEEEVAHIMADAVLAWWTVREQRT